MNINKKELTDLFKSMRIDSWTWAVMHPKTYKSLKKDAMRTRYLWRGYKPRGRKNIVHRYGGR